MLERPHADDPSVLDLGEECAPVRMIADEFHGGDPNVFTANSCRHLATVMAGLDPVMTSVVCRKLTHRYLIASGLTGEPTPPVIGIAGATNRNS